MTENHNLGYGDELPRKQYHNHVMSVYWFLTCVLLAIEKPDFFFLFPISLIPIWLIIIRMKKETQPTSSETAGFATQW